MNGIYNKFPNEFYFSRFRDNSITVLTRIRNESVILLDFLEHISKFADNIIVFDDDSNDNTLNICRLHDKVVAIVRNVYWTSENRSSLETLHRKLLLDCAVKNFASTWYFYMDADERIIGDNIREKVLSLDANDITHIRIPLFDAYLTKDDFIAVKENESLINRRVYFGLERRDIIFAWNKNAKAEYILDDAREPTIHNGKCILLFSCQHYGKAISLDKWDEKCKYYLNNFPYDSYGKKWESRLGKGIHTTSDFGTPLYYWGSALFSNAIIIHPL